MKTKLLKRLRREADEAADDYFFVWMNNPDYSRRQFERMHILRRYKLFDGCHLVNPEILCATGEEVAAELLKRI